ncbi:MAG: S9 family peptidase [Candidatus Riflebacteria bacterium]|nr:S9 family peptidase [Candidatus Riflebacteria bacterium]
MRTVKTVLVLLGLIALVSEPAWSRPPRRTGSRRTAPDGAPVPDRALKTRLQPYLSSRGAHVRDWAADGSSLYITTRFADTSQLHRLDMPMGARHQLTFFDEPVGRVLVSRDADSPFAVFSKDEGGGEDYQLCRLDLKSGRAVLLTDGKSRHATFELSADGRVLAFTSNARNGVDLDIWTMDPRDPGSRKLVCQVKGDFRIEDVSPDGSRVLAVEYISVNESSVHEVELASGRRTLVAPASPGPKVAFRNARWARDGRSVFVTSDRHGQFRELVRIERPGPERRLTAHIPWDVEEIRLSPGGQHLAFTVNEGGVSRLTVMDAQTGRELSPAPLPRGLIESLRFDPTGKRLAFTQTSPTIPTDAFTLDLTTNKVTRWTRSEVGGLDSSTWVEPELVTYPTFDQVSGKPRQLPLFYFRPRDLRPGERHPVIVAIHGGPESQWRPTFSPTRASFLEELRVAVLAPNVRGSSGYGKGYLMLDDVKLREDSVKDIGALLDWIATRPELDPGRVAVVGGSYGGYMVLSSMVHYADRIRAGVDEVGISSFVTFLENTKGYRRDLRRAEYGDERDPEVRKFLTRISPLTQASRIRSPLLCIQGANDPRVPASEAEQIVKALRANKVEAWYVVAANEGHGFNKKENQDLASLLTFQFLARFLVGSKAPGR